MCADHATGSRAALARGNFHRNDLFRAFRRSRRRSFQTRVEADADGARVGRRGSQRRVTPLAELLADRIRRYGPLTFADYMRECLYHPIHGYYSRAEATRSADYYTSVDLHPIFGRLLARQFAEMWEVPGRPEEFMLVEAGAGGGRLASHILDFS